MISNNGMLSINWQIFPEKYVYVNCEWNFVLKSEFLSTHAQNKHHQNSTPDKTKIVNMTTQFNEMFMTVFYRLVDWRVWWKLETKI